MVIAPPTSIYITYIESKSWPFERGTWWETCLGTPLFLDEPIAGKKIVNGEHLCNPMRTPVKLVSENSQLRKLKGLIGLDVVVNAKQPHSPRCCNDLFLPCPPADTPCRRIKDGEVWHAVILEETIHSDLVLGVQPLPSGNSWRKWKDQSQSPLPAFPVPSLAFWPDVAMTGRVGQMFKIFWG